MTRFLVATIQLATTASLTASAQVSPPTTQVHVDEHIMPGTLDVKFLDDAATVREGAFIVLRPDRLTFSDAIIGEPRESHWQGVFGSAASPPARRLLAAETLWRGQSRRSAEAVIAFTREEPPVDNSRNGFVAFQAQVAAALEPAAIQKSIDAGNLVWACWLATLQPHESLVPPLLKMLERHPKNTEEIVTALGRSRDARAFEPIVAVLRKADYSDSGFAALALADLGDARGEGELLEMLDESKAWQQACICSALGKIGTPAAVPALEAIVNGKYERSMIDVPGSARRAIQQIRERQ